MIESNCREHRNLIATIVVTYNRKDLLLECVEALLSQTEKCFDILIIDNASTDNTFEALQKYIEEKRVLYYNIGKNTGGAGGFNYGIKKAYELGYVYFWLMDDDTIPEKTALQELIKADSKLQGHYGFLSSYVEWIDGSICEMNVPARVDDIDSFPGYHEKTIIPIKTATFVSFFVQREMVEKVGLPIKEFFIWCDDTNYCIRISNFDCGYWITDSVVIHKMKVNAWSNLVYDNTDRLPRYVFEYRNQYYNARLTRELGQYYWRVIKRVGRICITSKDRKLLRIKYMLQGVWQGLFFNPSVEYVQTKQEII